MTTRTQASPAVPDGRERSDHGAIAVAERLIPPLLQRLAHVRRRPFIYGLCGAQGSGKSTVATIMSARLTADGVSTAALSIDDLYISGAARAALARDVHPLLRTRGAPGTHDLKLAWEVIAAAARPGPIVLPRFDKAQDEPCPTDALSTVQGPLQVLILEGWCVGAAPEPLDRLAEPANELERLEDADGLWRAWVNTQLGGAYQSLFARLDMLALIAAPSIGIVATWRREQEQHLRRSLLARGLPTDRTMSDPDVDRFVQLFERITTYVLSEMPERADVLIRLDEARRIVNGQVPRRGHPVQ